VPDLADDIVRFTPWFLVRGQLHFVGALALQHLATLRQTSIGQLHTRYTLKRQGISLSHQ
jgi:hypothetical protein